MIATGRCAVLVLAALALCPVARVSAATFVVDAGASRVRVHLGRTGVLKFLGHAHEIEAPITEGRIEVLDGDATRSSLFLRFESRRLAVVPGTEPAKDVPDVEARMRGREVLDAERHPELVFASTAVAVEAEGPTGSLRLRVRGTLDVKGRRVAIELPVEVRREAGSLRAEGEVWLELRTLGIEPPSVAGVVKVANRFRLTFVVRAQR